MIIIIARYSEIYFSMLLSRYESDTVIKLSQFTTFSSLSFDSNKLLSNYHDNLM